jgi:N-acyl homoserine lactone hydrolase
LVTRVEQKAADERLGRTSRGSGYDTLGASDIPLNYTIPEWVDAPGVTYEEVDGSREVLLDPRLVPARGHADRRRGDGRSVDRDRRRRRRPAQRARRTESEGQQRVRTIEPGLVWLAHEHEPWRPGRPA